MGQVRRSTAEAFVSGGGTFYWSGDELEVSSGKKRLLQGRYRFASGAVEPAVLTCYAGDERGVEAYARELATLSRNSTLGVGPRLFAPNGGVVDEAFPYTLVQEFAGAPLDLVLFEGYAIPSTGAFPVEGLAPLGTAEREAQNAKVLFDVAAQALNLHRSGRFHRDLRAANICVKRCGPAAGDVRATIVDFDLASDSHGRGLYCDNEYFKTLFETLRGRRLSPRMESTLPSPFEMDSAYLQALAYELRSGLRIGGLTSGDALSASPWPLYRVAADGTLFVRMLDQELDLDVLAKAAGLRAVDATLFPDPAQLSFVRAEIKHGGYVDALDVARVESECPEHEVLSNIDALARVIHERYSARWLEEHPDEEAISFDELGGDLKLSNLEQARAIPGKIASCGYRIARVESCDPRARVAAFSEDEVEFLAALEHRRWVQERKASGWVAGPERDVEHRITPFFVPYEELPEDAKEYDRAPIRDIIPLLESMGLVVVR